MSDLNEDRTVAFQDPTTVESDKNKTAQAAMIEVPKARLICTDTSQVDGALPGEGVIHLMPGSEQTVGRGDTCTYPIASRKLSRQHARIFQGVGAWGVEDLNSTNGVQVNRQKIKTAWLKHGDEVRFGAIPFRFELERPELARSAPAMPFAAAAMAGGEEGEGDRTMMVGSLGASKAVIEATRKTEEPAPEPVVPRHPTVAAAAATESGQSGIGRGVMLGVGAALVIALGVGGFFYYPAWQKQQMIAGVTGRGGEVVQRVMARSRELGNAGPTDPSFREDQQRLAPMINETWALLQDNPSNLDLINLYAQAYFLNFERSFAAAFGQANFTDAERLANEAKARLDELDRRLPVSVAANDKSDLTTAAGLADMASILITYRRFGRDYQQVAKSTPDRPVRMPTLAQIDQVDARREDFIRYRKAFNQPLSRDYRPFYQIVQEIENRDLTLIGRWRELLRSPN